MWKTHRVGMTADNIVRYTASSLIVVKYSLRQLQSGSKTGKFNQSLTQ